MSALTDGGVDSGRELELLLPRSLRVADQLFSQRGGPAAEIGSAAAAASADLATEG